MRLFLRPFLAILLLMPASAAWAAEPLGRLFFTPEQRAQLDTLRIKKVVASQTKDEPAPEFVTYNGIVRRSDGKAIVWINSKALTEAELRSEESITGRISRDGQILLQSPAAGAGKMQLKVGQSAELLSGRVADSHSALQSQSASAPAKPEAKPAATKPEPAGRDTQAGGSAENTTPATSQAPASRP